MERLARLVMHHRRIIGAFWILMLLAGGFAASQLSSRLTVDFSLPGQPGDTAEQHLIKTYGTSSFDTYLAVVTVPAGQTVRSDQTQVDRVFGAVRKALPVSRIVDLQNTGDPGFVSKDGRTTFAMIQGPQPTSFGPGIETQIEPALTAAAQQAGFTSGLTSYGLLGQGGDSSGPSVLAETLFGATGALLVLIFVFASFLALVPLMIAAVSILTCFLLVLGLTTFSDVSFVVQFLIALIGLGVAIDYSLLVVSRWREERAHGRGNEDAVVVAMKTAGHAVFASGVTVAISLLALVVVPVPFLRSMGVGGMLIPLVSVAVVLTLLPALLSSIGPRMDYPRIRKEATASRGWTAWARAIVGHRFIATGVAIVALGLLIIPVFSLKIGEAGVSSLARNGPAFSALQTLRAGGIGTGVLTPVEVLVPAGDARAAAAAARHVDGVQMAVVGGTKDGLAVVDAVPVRETVDSSSGAVVDQIRTAVEQHTSGPVQVTGTGAVVQDYFSAVYNNFPYVLALIAIITFVLLVRTFRSLLLPIKAVLLNLVSLSAVFGSIVFFWQMGHGSDTIFSVSPTGAITFWLPVLIFAFLFGLSMDYEVFILSRMREEYDATGDTRAAVVTGLGRTGRLVTSAALILFFAFAALASSPGTDIKVLGTALGVGILIDATLVRALLVPALVSVLGRWNWWLPAWMAKVLRVAPSPLAPRRDRDSDTGPTDPGDDHRDTRPVDPVGV
ncbi:MAG: putative drug exporter of the superfamily [Nocardioidaceae bacterium]|jgi:RND superfamily putative drug exporter|nr:putative drug exporter of the superfamily [Nocardioidaceae bacterium]